MTVIDVENLLSPISDEEPCGPSLEYDPDYTELERLAAGSPEQRIGDSVIEAVEPNWKDVSKRSIDLLGRTKDLRLILWVIVAQLELEGFPGLRAGLRLLRESIERYWDHVHPQLDPDDNNDPVARINLIASLAIPHSSLNDPLRFTMRVLRTPLTNSQMLGRFGVRDVQVASGEVDAPASSEDGEGEESAGSGGPNSSTIQGAFEDTSVEDLTAVGEAIDESLAEVTQIDALQTEKVGASDAASLSELTEALRAAQRILRDALQRRGIGEGSEDDGESGDGGDGSGSAGQGPRLTGEIQSRDDVLQALDKICRYYERHEPSSPVPVLVRRAQRLVARSFVEIIRDMAPSGLGEIEVIGGEQFGSGE